MKEKGKEIGKVNHWYDHVSVGVVKLSAPLKVGDRVKVRHGDSEFESEIATMEVDHKSVTSGKKGDEVAVRFPQKAKAGSVLLAVE